MSPAGLAAWLRCLQCPQRLHRLHAWRPSPHLYLYVVPPIRCLPRFSSLATRTRALLRARRRRLPSVRRAAPPRAPQLANAQSALKAEQGRASLLAVCGDHTLAGPALAAEVDKLVRLGMKAPNDFWERLMSERSQLIMAASNRHAREKAALEQGQTELQASTGCGPAGKACQPEVQLCLWRLAGRAQRTKAATGAGRGGG